MKTLRYRNGKIKVFGITKGFVTYGKNANNKYRIEIFSKVLGEKITIPLYQGNKKPFIRNLGLINILFFPFYLTSFIAIPVAILFWVYFDGGRNFINNYAWVQNVREFNWINIFLVIILTIILILQNI